MDNGWTFSIPPLALSKKPTSSVLGSLDNYHGQRDRLMASAARSRVKPLEAENCHPCVGGKTLPGKRKKRAPLSPEQLRLLSRRIDPTQPSKPALPIAYKPSPRKRLRVQPDNTEIPPSLNFMPTTSAVTDAATITNTTAQQHCLSSLYQTCFDIWPGAPSLGDLSHDKVKNLSELLKVRLSQAKFRVIAALEAEGRGTDVLYQQLKSSEECSIWPTGFIGKKRKIKLSKKCNQAPWGVTVGNARNLKRVSPTMPIRASPAVLSSPLPSTPLRKEELKQKDDQHDQQQQQQHNSPRKIKRRTPADPALAAVTLQDGSRAFICKNCNKKYKNRGGLVYHRDRCKQRKPDKPINCACGERHQSDQLVQCETCHLYSHLECIGLDENELNNEGAFHCTTCVLPPTTGTDNLKADLRDTTTSLQGPIWEDFSLSPSSTWTASPGGDALTPSLYHSDMGLLTPSTTIINTPSPAMSPSSSQQSDSLWFEFANFDTDFTFNDSQNEQQQ